MSEPLLKTKLYVPHIRSEAVSRPRLIEQLSEGLRRGSRLTLISAPAGYGKTTLLGQWIAGDELATRAAWVSLDEGDNDPVRFFAYLMASLQKIAPDIGKTAQAMLQASQPPPSEPLLATLINDVAEKAQPFILVLDDYHVIEAEPIHEAMAFLLDHVPPQMHVVLAARADPPLPIARLRGRGHMTGLYQADLRFTPKEAAAFLNEVMGLDLSAGEIAALEERTEGWIAGLQMAAVSMRGRDDVAGFVHAFTGSHRFILDYLGGEVLGQQPEGVREFLLQTAILNRLTASLCSAVVERGPLDEMHLDSQAMLEYLERSNLFVVPLDDERCWYRYHHLFADLLRQRLQRQKSDLVRELHRRASDWYEANELMAEAVEHALTARDLERAARLIEQAGWDSFTRGEMATILGWMVALPDDLIRSRPQLSLLHAWALAKSGQLEDVERCLRDVDLRHFQGEAAAVRAYVAGVRGDLARAVELAQKALHHLPEDNLLLRAIVSQNLGVAYHWSGDSAAAVRSLTKAVELSHAANQAFQTLTAMAILGRALEMQGSLRQAVETYRDALDLVSEPDRRPVPFACMAYVGMAGLLYEWNNLDDAMRCVNQGIRLSELGGFVAYQVLGRAFQAQIYEAQGNRRSAADVLQEAERLGKGCDYALVLALVAEFRVRLSVAQGNVAAASRWAQERRVSPGEALDAADEIEQMAVARVFMAQGEPGEALSLLSWLLEVAEAAGRMGSVIKILALQALAMRAQGNVAQSLSVLERALSLGGPEGYVRTFIDEGEPMVRLLRVALSRGIVPNYVARLLAAFGEEADLSPPAMASMVEPLTERELEVLHLIVAGLSNPEIAEELFIAVSTVKSHVNHIYGKLGASNRVEAVTKAQDLGLM